MRAVKKSLRIDPIDNPHHPSPLPLCQTDGCKKRFDDYKIICYVVHNNKEALKKKIGTKASEINFLKDICFTNLHVYSNMTMMLTEKFFLSESEIIKQRDPTEPSTQIF